MMKPHHGEIRALDSDEKLALLRSSYQGHLGCISHGEVYVLPVTFVYEDGFIYSHARPGKKIEGMRRNPNVCLQAEVVTDFRSWKSVIAWGTFEELHGDAAAAGMHLLVAALRKYEPPVRMSTLEADFSAILESAIVYRIRVSRVTGRAEGSMTHPREQK